MTGLRSHAAMIHLPENTNATTKKQHNSENLDKCYNGTSHTHTLSNNIIGSRDGKERNKKGLI